MSHPSSGEFSPGWDGEDLEGLDADLDTVSKEGDQVLHLNYRGLTEMPQRLISEAPDFRNITRIYMKRNKLTSLPEDIQKLSNLVELYLPANNLTSLPQGLTKLHSLESLDVSHNCLQELPTFIGSMPCLEVLRLANNRLNSLPREISGLKTLRILDVINNELDDLPRDLINCQNLTRLLVDRNNLFWLPTHIVTMAKLEEISATGNTFLYLPTDLGNMPSLKYVYVDNNPYLHAVPLSIENLELGFSSSGVRNFTGQINRQLQRITIDELSSEPKVIYLPREIQRFEDLETAPIPSLLELSLRSTSRAFPKRSFNKGELPFNIHKLMDAQAGSCHICKCPIFTSAFPLIFDGQIRIYNLYRLAMCCSARCVKLAMVVIPLPLIYPSANELHVQVALVD